MAGECAPGSLRPRNLERRPYRWTAPSGLGLLPLPSIGTLGCSFAGASADGRYLATTCIGSPFALLRAAFRFDGDTGTMEPLVPGASTVTGVASLSDDGGVAFGTDGTSVFRWSASTGAVALPALPNGDACTVRAGSRDGSTALLQCGVSGRLYRWSGGPQLEPLGPLPVATPAGSAALLSGDGRVVVGRGVVGAPALGRFAMSSATTELFLWDAEHGVRLLAPLLAGAGVDLTGWDLGTPAALARDGAAVVGTGTNPVGAQEGWALFLPELRDTDADRVADAQDNCPHAANPSQADAGGLGAASAPDAIGDACQCGDVSGDGRVTLADAVLVARASLVPAAAPLARPERCDVGGGAGCTIADAMILRRALLSPPSATLRPQCAPARPPS